MKSKSKALYLLAALILVFALPAAGCAPAIKAGTVTIKGDVANVLEFSDLKALQKVSLNGQRYRAIPLAAVLEQAEPYGLRRVTFVGGDNHSAIIEVADLAGSYLAWSGEHYWHFVSERYPINTAIKDIKEIIVEGDGSHGLHITTYGRDYPVLSPGQMLGSSHWLYFHEQGSSSREVDGKHYGGTVISRHAVRQLRDLVPGSAQKVLAIGLDGSMHRLSMESYVEAYGNGIYLNKFDHKPRLPLAGLVLDPPERCITDLFGDVLDRVERGERVLVVLVDGFGYPLYEAAVNENLAPHILDGAKVDQALSVYVPITNCGCAAMLSGETPDVNGVHSRQDRELKVPGLLEELAKRGKKGVIFEGQTIILKMEGEVVLNSDRDKDGETDDDILESALEQLDGYDMVFVHFHSVDDYAHSYGPLAAETKQQLSVVDAYAGQLFAAWEGSRIVLADHGMHKTGDGGNHGEFRYEDLYVPYFYYYE